MLLLICHLPIDRSGNFGHWRTSILEMGVCLDSFLISNSIYQWWYSAFQLPSFIPAQNGTWISLSSVNVGRLYVHFHVPDNTLTRLPLQTCLGIVKGAKYLSKAVVLARGFVNPWILQLLDERDGNSPSRARSARSHLWCCRVSRLMPLYNSKQAEAGGDMEPIK